MATCYYIFLKNFQIYYWKSKIVLTIKQTTSKESGKLKKLDAIFIIIWCRRRSRFAEGDVVISFSILLLLFLLLLLHLFLQPTILIIILVKFCRHWILLDSVGFFWILLDSFGFLLDSSGLVWPIIMVIWSIMIMMTE